MTKQERIDELAKSISGLERKPDFSKYDEAESREAILELSGDKDSIIAKRELVELICKTMEAEIKGPGCWDVLFSIKYNGPFDDSEEADARRQESYESMQKMRQEFKDGIAKIEAEYAAKEAGGIH